MCLWLLGKRGSSCLGTYYSLRRPDIRSLWHCSRLGRPWEAVLCCTASNKGHSGLDYHVYMLRAGHLPVHPGAAGGGPAPHHSYSLWWRLS